MVKHNALFRWSISVFAISALMSILALSVIAQDDDALESPLMDDFESGELFSAVDSFNNDIGFATWGDTEGNVELSLAEMERDDNMTTVLQINYDVEAWGGFTHALSDGEDWISQDWTAFSALQFWLFGNNTGGTVQVEIFDNRNPELNGDSAERWYYRITDDYEGWQQFTIPFDAFQRRTDFQPGGAPNDGLNLDEVSGVAFGMPTGTGAQVTFVDDITVVVLDVDPLTVDDFEIDDLFISMDADGNDIGFVTWGAVEGNVELRLADAIRGGVDTRALTIDFDIEQWGGFSHVFTDGENWITQDWSDYNTISFWYLGNNSGAEVQFEIFDNRNPESTGDSAERWFYRFVDNSYTWEFVEIPLVDFQRRTDFQPNGAPDDGLNLNQVHGYAFTMPAGTGDRVHLVDDIRLTLVAGVEMPDTTEEGIVNNTPAFEIDRSITWDSRDWELMWSDEFDADTGTPINEEYWTCETGGWGWGNNERQYYTTDIENAQHDGDGNLVITALEDDTYPYTSARCITQDKVEFMYGRVEARIQIPTGQGIWPAFWMLGAEFPQTSWPFSGEIDIMENIGSEPNVIHGTIHGPGYSGGQGIGNSYRGDEPFTDDFHVYAIDWDPYVIRWYVDGEMYGIVSVNSMVGREWVFNQEFFLLMNVAVGGNWPGYPDDTTEFPQQMVIDYVRVYQLAE